MRVVGLPYLKEGLPEVAFESSAECSKLCRYPVHGRKGVGMHKQEEGGVAGAGEQEA